MSCDIFQHSLESLGTRNKQNTTVFSQKDIGQQISLLSSPGRNHAGR